MIASCHGEAQVSCRWRCCRRIDRRRANVVRWCFAPPATDLHAFGVKTNERADALCASLRLRGMLLEKES